MSEATETQKPNIATMTSDRLYEHIKSLEERHKRLMTTLRALAKAKKAEEEAAE